MALTIEQIEGMTKEERLALFEKMATTYVGKKNYGPTFAKMIGAGRNTVYNWQSGRTAVPPEVMMLLDCWLGGLRTNPPPPPDLELVAEQLAEALKALAKPVATLERVARRRAASIGSLDDAD